MEIIKGNDFRYGGHSITGVFTLTDVRRKRGEKRELRTGKR